MIIFTHEEVVAARAWPSVSTHELEHGVPFFLQQLAQPRTANETEHLGRAAHELRDLLNTSLLAFPGSETR